MKKKYIKDFKELKKLTKKGPFEVDVILNYGLYSRKIVDFNCRSLFNYIDESEIEFKTVEDAKKYWNEHYFDRGAKILFVGYN